MSKDKDSEGADNVPAWAATDNAYNADVPLPASVCPSCGYCPTCGRKNAYSGQYWYYPYQPITWNSLPGTWTYTSGTSDTSATFYG